MFFTVMHIMCVVHFCIHDFLSYVALHFIHALHVTAFHMDSMPFISPHLIRSLCIGMFVMSLFLSFEVGFHITEQTSIL